MDTDLAKTLEDYLRGGSIKQLRERAVSILGGGMSDALGETREPANDVTLWAQAYGVASLYKPCLATLALDKEPCPRKGAEWDYDDLRWRLFGVGWNGLAFLQRGRRPADILRRQEILAELHKQLSQMLEVEHPIGNLFYSDLNGLFFTFPGIQDEPASELVKELSPTLVQAVRRASDDELWPFFTLSN